MTRQRAARARLLAGRYPAAREALLFCAEIFEFQASVDPERPLAAWSELAAVVAMIGPQPLREAVKTFDEAMLDAYLADPSAGDATRNFFARVLLQPVMYASRAPCPACDVAPQVACLWPVGDGTALSLVCSLCLRESPLARERCLACADPAIAWYSAEGLEHVQVRVCERCRAYLHVVDLSKDPAAIPDVDELAALPLDVWARERDYRKIQVNLVGA